MTSALTVAILTLVAPDTSWQRHVYPLEKPLSPPPFVLDTEKFPESRAWGEQAVRLAEQWYPTVTMLLATEDFKAPANIVIRILPDASAPAYASGNTITVNGKWITQRPDDFGMIIHELVHVVQQYPQSKFKPGWLVEGIADYIRWWRYEPEAPRRRIDPAQAKLTDGYTTTAAFLAWSSARYDRRLVPALDRALRKAEDPEPVFKSVTGKEMNALWDEFLATNR